MKWLSVSFDRKESEFGEFIGYDVFGVRSFDYNSGDYRLWLYFPPESGQMAVFIDNVHAVSTFCSEIEFTRKGWMDRLFQ